MTFLFDKVVFGPVHSRRLGVSLGINLLPTFCKYCSFDCLYCECGWTEEDHLASDVSYPPAAFVHQQLENKLIEMQKNKQLPDSISFAGNGEPTLHPEFVQVINDTIELRNKYAPESNISVLSNATMLHKPEIVEALKKVNLCILKLDAGTEEMFQRINKPMIDITLQETINNLKQFTSGLIIQTLFVRGSAQNPEIDNTSDKEVNEWLKHLEFLKPERVMIYPIARATPHSGLVKVSREELDAIAEKVNKLGIKAEVY